MYIYLFVCIFVYLYKESQILGQSNKNNETFNLQVHITYI